MATTKRVLGGVRLQVGRVAARGGAAAKPVRALAAQATASSKAIRKQALADVKLVKERMARMRQDFYDIGLALARLKQPAAYASLGYESFEKLCKDEFGLSPMTARRYVTVVQQVSRELAERRGVTVAWLLTQLAAATAEEDTPEQLDGAKIKTASGKVVDVETASTGELKEALQEMHSSQPLDRGGRKLEERDRQIAKLLQRELRAAGLTRASVRAVARKRGQADLHISSVPIASYAELGRVLTRTKPLRGG